MTDTLNPTSTDLLELIGLDDKVSLPRSASVPAKFTPSGGVDNVLAEIFPPDKPISPSSHRVGAGKIPAETPPLARQVGGDIEVNSAVWHGLSAPRSIDELMTQVNADPTTVPASRDLERMLLNMLKEA